MLKVALRQAQPRLKTTFERTPEQLFYFESNLMSRLLLRIGQRNYQLADSFEDRLKLIVAFLLHLCHFSRKLLVISQHFPQGYECSHDLYVYADSSLAVENAGEHCHPQLRESIRKLPRPSPS